MALEADGDVEGRGSISVVEIDSWRRTLAFRAVYRGIWAACRLGGSSNFRLLDLPIGSYFLICSSDGEGT